MAELYLHCAICGRKQASGLLSSGAWGQVPLPAGIRVDHPAVRDSTARTCPTCIDKGGDWPSRALASLGIPSRA